MALTNTVAPAITVVLDVDNKVVGLEVSNGTWTGHTPDSYTRQWYRSTSAIKAGRAAISGETSATYTLLSSDVGKYFDCEVTAHTTEDSTAADADIFGPVVAYPEPVLPVTVNGARMGSIIKPSVTAVAGITYTYQWQRGDTEQTYVNISGATTKNYKPTLTDIHKYLNLVVTATDAENPGNPQVYNLAAGKVPAVPAPYFNRIYRR